MIDADEGVVYEVVNYEGDASMQKKGKSYPLEVRFISANDVFREELLL